LKFHCESPLLFNAAAAITDKPLHYYRQEIYRAEAIHVINGYAVSPWPDGGFPGLLWFCNKLMHNDYACSTLIKRINKKLFRIAHGLRLPTAM
jgi:hypothetical protein